MKNRSMNGVALLLLAIVVAAAMSACAGSGGSWNTAIWKQAATSGCKTFQVPNNLPRLTEDYGLDWTPNTILVRVADKERWTKQKRSWPKDGRFLVRTTACSGDGWMVVTLTKQKEATPLNPAGTEMSPEVWLATEVPPPDWNK